MSRRATQSNRKINNFLHNLILSMQMWKMNKINLFKSTKTQKIKRVKIFWKKTFHVSTNIITPC